MNSKIKSILLKYKEKNINKLDIYFGNNILSSKSDIIFDKHIPKDKFNIFLNHISSMNYKNTFYKQKIYNSNSNYLDTKHTTKTNINSNIDDTKLYVYYLETEHPYHSFPANKEYNIIEQHVNNYNINNEINILFINNDKIQISLIINHNIDHSIKQLDNLFTIPI